MPRFSILITSRNRPDLVVHSLLSVLDQDFQNFEVVVSDNSDNDLSTETYSVLAPYLADGRARYIRPPRVLNMTDHWEWAIEQLNGEYVGILTDRMVYRLNALSRINEYIAKNNPTVVAFGTTNIIEAPDGFRIPSTSASLSVVRNSITPFIEAFRKSDFSRLDMPRLLNSFVKNSFLQSLREEYGKVFSGISPDYSFFMRVADQMDSFPFIANELVLKHSEGRSNGKSFTWFNLTKTSYDFIELMIRDQAEFLAFSPIPEEMLLLTNGMSREYECGRHFAKRKIFPPYDKQSFYNESMKLIRKYAAEGKNVSEFMERIEVFRAENGLIREMSHSEKAITHFFKRIFKGVRRRIKSRMAPRETSLHPTILAALREDCGVHKSEHPRTLT